MTAEGVVTSTTRPPNPMVGDRIFETDTGSVLYWYGPDYKWLPNRAATRLLGFAEGTASVGAVNDALTLTIPFGKIRGRQVYWVANFPGIASSPSLAIYQLVDPANTVIDSRTFQGAISPSVLHQGSFTMAHRESFPITLLADVTRKLRVQSGSIPAGIYNLFCFDEGFVGTLPMWDSAKWDVDLWGP